jgi:hypothetical protein
MMSGSSTNLSNGSAHWATSDQRWRLQYRQLQRIQNKLEEFLSPQDARETIMSIYDLVLEIDQELDRILMDRLVQSSYEYDGQFFTPKHSWGFHRAFDGVHVLRSLHDPMIETFFYGREKGFAVRWLVDELDKHTWEATVRRMNWQESQTLSIVPKQVLVEIVQNVREKARQAEEAIAPLSPEEKTFFKSFEEQMSHGLPVLRTPICWPPLPSG